MRVRVGVRAGVRVRVRVRAGLGLGLWLELGLGFGFGLGLGLGLGCGHARESSRCSRCAAAVRRSCLTLALCSRAHTDLVRSRGTGWSMVSGKGMVRGRGMVRGGVGVGVRGRVEGPHGPILEA